MSHVDLNEIFIFSCIALITATPFYFRYWLKLYPVRTIETIDLITSRLSILIFAALFAGAFVFGQRSSKTAEVLLGAAILSFSILYQSRFRYLVRQNSAKERLPNSENSHANGHSPVYSAAASSARNVAPKTDLDGLLRKLAIFSVGGSLAFLISKWPVLLVSLMFYPYFMPLLVRFKFKATPMNESQLKEDFKNIFANASTRVREMYLIDSETYTRNAMMVGSALFITLDLFQRLNDAELKAVISHEASHLQKHHSLKRVLSSFGAFVLISFWIFLPTTLVFMGSQTAIFLAVPVLIVANNFFLGKIVRRQEMEADLGAIELGASSDSLISALHKLSPAGKSKNVPWSTRLIFGAYHPTTEERETVIRNGGLPKTAYFQKKKYAYAYSLLVLGYTFHVANQMATNPVGPNMTRVPATTTETSSNSATISHLEMPDADRSVH